MSDETADPKPKRMMHRAAPAQQAPLHTRLASLEGALRSLVDSLPQMISTGSLTVGQRVYDSIAAEHGAVFEVQEQAFMAIADALDHRLRLLEEAAGIAAPTSTSFRDLIDAIADYSGAVAESKGDLQPWKTLDAESKATIVATYLEDRARREAIAAVPTTVPT